MGPHGLLPCSEKPATVPRTKPAYMNSVHKIAHFFFYIHSNIICPFTSSLNGGLFPSIVPTKLLYALLFTPVCSTYPAHLIILDLIIPIIFGEECKLCYALRNFLQPLIISSLLDPNILHSTSDTLGVCFAVNVRDKISHSLKITGKIIILLILIS
jgi:hypothetical protein